MPNPTKKDLERLLKEQISENRALEQRLQDMEVFTMTTQSTFSQMVVIIWADFF